ncbi:DUF4386 domain-containing protein [Xanthomonas oryzae pv. oryzae]|nr:DUF4386 domain-containing protein [Xanthomonas oryzae]ACD57651.1 lipoprotein, putative [Xanthomonas oryzae pv. oryzae PXO99A]AWK19752.1 hypothetical protein B9W05_14600 [Xanthomonas oryzae pv. oryzae]AXI18893.1 DUF4386 domain-containing protein [Xanthomonas oryzae pv. oryzae]AXI22878.1 DUF4386 domain-containing protein [Xanthomonas oryzae pv. oryzae]AXM11034.1 DUF4386 domain-containing protein [Xanthomonas oryzae pv. oryzae]
MGSRWHQWHCWATASRSIAPIFSGAACLVSDSVIYRSTYLPRTVGVLMLLAGISYLIAAFAQQLAPEFAATINPGILLPVLVGGTTLCLWLLLKGVNRARRDARVSESSA